MPQRFFTDESTLPAALIDRTFVCATTLCVLILSARCNAADDERHPGPRATAYQAEPNRTALRARIDQAVTPLLSTHAVPGLAVAVTLNGQVSYFNYGVAQIASRAPVTENTLFEIGSVSKTFTATLGAYAEAVGALRMNDHPSRYLTALQGTPLDSATLQQLATYTAGELPLQFPDAVQDPASMSDYFRRWQPISPAGTQRLYSNPSIGLFGLIAAQALQREFNDAMQTILFAPLGLKHTYLQVPAEAVGAYAWGYNRANQPTRANPGVLDAETYGIKTSSADLLRFVQLQIDPEALPPALRQAVHATHLGRYQVGPMVQGLGWEQYSFPVPLAQLLAGNSEAMLFDPNPVRWIFPARREAVAGSILYDKTGSTNGFGAYVAVVPAAHIGVVILANKNYPIAARVTAAHQILGELARQAGSVASAHTLE